MRAHGGQAMHGTSTRSKFKGISDLATSTVPSIAKGIYEEEESIYNLKESKEEQKLFEVNDSLNHCLIAPSIHCFMDSLIRRCLESVIHRYIDSARHRFNMYFIHLFIDSLFQGLIDSFIRRFIDASIQ